MDTQTQLKINSIIDQMVKSGMPVIQATAVGAAIEHSLTSPEYASRYGTFCQEALVEFVESAQ